VYIAYTVRREDKSNDKSPVSEGEHRVKTEDELDESHKSQLKV